MEAKALIDPQKVEALKADTEAFAMLKKIKDSPSEIIQCLRVGFSTEFYLTFGCTKIFSLRRNAKRALLVAQPTML